MVVLGLQLHGVLVVPSDLCVTGEEESLVVHDPVEHLHKKRGGENAVSFTDWTENAKGLSSSGLLTTTALRIRKGLWFSVWNQPKPFNHSSLQWLLEANHPQLLCNKNKRTSYVCAVCAHVCLQRPLHFTLHLFLSVFFHCSSLYMFGGRKSVFNYTSDTFHSIALSTAGFIQLHFPAPHMQHHTILRHGQHAGTHSSIHLLSVCTHTNTQLRLYFTTI